MTDNPKTIRRAVTCLVISLVLAVVLDVALGTGLLQPPGGASNVVNFGSAALLALVTWKVAVGRRWARWLFVILYVLGTLAGVIMFLVRPEIFLAWPKVMIASSLVQLALQSAAVAFLFMPTSNAWFRSRPVGPASTGRGA